MIGDEWTYLWTPCLTFLVAAGSPDPATLAVAATAMSGGRRNGLALGAGLSIGLALWGAVAAAGLGALVINSVPALVTLRIVGGLYLLWLACDAAKSAFSDAAGTGRAVETMTVFGLVRRGLILNGTNPKAVLAWMAVLTMGLPDGAGSVELWTITTACAAIGAAVYVLYSAAFSVAPVMAFYSRTRRVVHAALAAVFGAAGLRLIFSRTGTP